MGFFSFYSFLDKHFLEIITEFVFLVVFYKFYKYIPLITEKDILGCDRPEKHISGIDSRNIAGFCPFRLFWIQKIPQKPAKFDQNLDQI